MGHGNLDLAGHLLSSVALGFYWSLKAGDFVKCDTESNFVLANPDPSAVADFDGADSLLTRANIGDTFSSIVGQVIEVEEEVTADA